MYDQPGNEGMREKAEDINVTLRKLSVEAGFEVHGWEKSLLDVCGTIKPQWLIRVPIQ